jgi:TetR/AcrR family transcriptional regulator, cholesterol catabolism regulator
MNSHMPRSRLLRNSRLLRRADAIIDAAASVFAERGYHGASTQAIADVLGMRQASLYYYFASKETALELVCEKGVDAFVDRAEAIAAGVGAPLEKLHALFVSHLAPNETKPDYVRVFINERRYLPEASRRRIGRKSRRIERCFEDVIRAGIADGSISMGTDVRTTMLAVLGMCNSVINWRAGDRGQDMRRIASELGRLIIGGIGAGTALARSRHERAGIVRCVKGR